MASDKLVLSGLNGLGYLGVLPFISAKMPPATQAAAMQTATHPATQSSAVDSLLASKNAAAKLKTAAAKAKSDAAALMVKAKANAQAVKTAPTVDGKVAAGLQHIANVGQAQRLTHAATTFLAASNLHAAAAKAKDPMAKAINTQAAGTLLKSVLPAIGAKIAVDLPAALRNVKPALPTANSGARIVGGRVVTPRTPLSPGTGLPRPASPMIPPGNTANAVAKASGVGYRVPDLRPTQGAAHVAWPTGNMNRGSFPAPGGSPNEVAKSAPRPGSYPEPAPISIEVAATFRGGGIEGLGDIFSDITKSIQQVAQTAAQTVSGVFGGAVKSVTGSVAGAATQTPVAQAINSALSQAQAATQPPASSPYSSWMPPTSGNMTTSDYLKWGGIIGGGGLLAFFGLRAATR